jgi:hypothetical protein
MTKTIYERAKRTLWQWALPPIVRSVGEESFRDKLGKYEFVRLSRLHIIRK